MSSTQNQSSSKKSAKELADSMQDDILMQNQSVFSEDSEIQKYKRIIYGAIVVILISGLLGFGYYIMKPSISENGLNGSSVTEMDKYDSVIYVPNKTVSQEVIKGRIRLYNSPEGSYKYVLIAESGDGKVIQYYLVSDNIDLGLSEGYPVELHGKFIEKDNVFNVKSVKLK